MGEINGINTTEECKAVVLKPDCTQKSPGEVLKIQMLKKKKKKIQLPRPNFRQIPSGSPRGSMVA